MSLSFDPIDSLIAAHPHSRRLLVAYSGGVDSHVLLHLLATHRSKLGERTLTAVHVDHGLSPASSEWGAHCQRVSNELGIRLISLNVDARPSAGESPEAAARRARYRALASLLRDGDILITAHHRDDQAETLLLQLLRGAGPNGLAAMPVCAPLGKGRLLRPLLQTERADILRYAESHGLGWIEDGSNFDRKLDRNFLRHDILPRLRTRWPGLAKNLSRSARLCAEAAGCLDALADRDLAAASERVDRLDIPALRSLNESRQRNALRRWLQRLQLPLPSASHLDHIVHDLVPAPPDRQPLIRWPGCEIRRYRESLYAMTPRPAHDRHQVVPWPSGDVLFIPNIGQLSLRSVYGSGLRGAAIHKQPLTVRFRHGGERFHPSGRRHSQELKKLLQEANVPPWERDRIPLLYAGETLIAVAGLWTAKDFTVDSGETGWVLQWQKASSSDTFPDYSIIL